MSKSNSTRITWYKSITFYSSSSLCALQSLPKHRVGLPYKNPSGATHASPDWSPAVFIQPALPPRPMPRAAWSCVKTAGDQYSTIVICLVLTFSYHKSSSNNCVRSDQGHHAVFNLCVNLSIHVCYQVSQVSNMTAIKIYHFLYSLLF